MIFEGVGAPQAYGGAALRARAAMRQSQRGGISPGSATGTLHASTRRGVEEKVCVVGSKVTEEPNRQSYALRGGWWQKAAEGSRRIQFQGLMSSTPSEEVDSRSRCQYA